MLTLTLNPAIDKSSTVDKVSSNKKLRCQTPKFSAGGGGINVARATTHLGGKAKAVYPAGGPSVEILERILDETGVFQIRIPTELSVRENLTIAENSTNSQYRFGMPGAHLREEEWKKCLEVSLQESHGEEFVVASGSLPPGVPEDFYAQLASSFKKERVKLIVDTSGGPLKALKGAGVYLLKPNLRELSDLVGGELETQAERKTAARKLISEGTCEVVVLSLGAEGLFVVTEDSAERIGTPEVEVKSRIGAGDSTVAGIVLGLESGLDLKEAVMFGAACGAAAVMTPGTDLCHRNDAERLFEKMKDHSEAC